MTTTTTPLPPGAYVLSDWHDWDNEFRIISTETREVDGTDVGVSVDAPQLPDGALLNHAELKPQVRVDRRNGSGWAEAQRDGHLVASGRCAAGQIGQCPGDSMDL